MAPDAKLYPDRIEYTKNICGYYEKIFTVDYIKIKKKGKYNMVLMITILYG